ncbi:hypothetical protein Trydic_g1952 [Trypoxylus dichotomus]
MPQEIDKTHYILPLDQPIVYLDANTAFQGLTDQEKLYAYYLRNLKQFKEVASNAGFSEDDITALLVYSAGIFCNAGNYKGFGDSKFIPGIEAPKLEKLLHLSPVWNQIEPLWEMCKDAIYDLSSGKTSSANCGEIEMEEFNGATYSLTNGDYSPLMEGLVQYLQKAVPYAANDIQVNMLKAYIESFTTGSLQKHKEGSRFWIQDKIPAIETYIGFIETYRDPAGIRAEFEGFVAAVNRPMSSKFATLVENAEELLHLLPWPRGFEKDTFLRPDFTSLDVLTFSGSGIPAGINIPNYDDIRQTEGFKNVSLGNVIPASYQQSVIPFLNNTDIQLLQKYRVMAFEVQKGANGSLNYSSTLLDPLTGEPPVSYYEAGDTYDSCFGPISSAYEECRAEAVGLYLSVESNVLSIFGHNGTDADDIVYVNWLSLAWAGLCSLEMWDPNRGWLQAHSQARFALTRVLIEAGVVNILQSTPQDLLLSIDRTSIKGAGRNAIGHFLLKLQIYKSTANISAAKKLFQKYTDVTNQWISWRDIVLANKRPRKMFTQPNMILNKQVELKPYEASPEGLIQSWVERFDEPELLHEALLMLSKKDAHFFI